MAGNNRSAKFRVLIACEFSGRVRDAFIKKGHSAISCDLLPTHSPGPHIQDDVLNHLNEGWDLMIGHPDCTYLCTGGLANETRRPYLQWKKHQKESLEFVKKLMRAPIPRIAIENPRGKISTAIRPADQTLFAWQFGEIYQKDICLWLKNLPPLIPTCTKKPENLKTFDFWSSDRYTPEGGNKKAITFPGVADAMASQWGSPLTLESFGSFSPAVV